MRRAVLALLLCCISLAGRGDETKRITFADYVLALQRIHTSLQTKQLDAARNDARALRGAEVVSARGNFHTDDALLGTIVAAKTIDPTVRARLGATLDELRRAVPEDAGTADRPLLQKLDAERRAHDLSAGGEVPTEVDTDVPFVRRVWEALAAAVEWIAERLAALVDWLLDFLPRNDAKDKGAGGGIGGIVTFIAALIVLLLIALALQVLRRGRGAEVIAAADVPLESRDADPLSRGTTEWERYAAQLAAAERWREAIRAWYHAVLVTLYSGGILHFRKGKTNWEYIASLAPSLAWRGEYVELTRRFEQEWYGARESSADAYDDCSERAARILGEIRKTSRGAA